MHTFISKRSIRMKLFNVRVACMVTAILIGMLCYANTKNSDRTKLDVNLDIATKHDTIHLSETISDQMIDTTTREYIEERLNMNDNNHKSSTEIKTDTTEISEFINDLKPTNNTHQRLNSAVISLAVMELNKTGVDVPDDHTPQKSSPVAEELTVVLSDNKTVPQNHNTKKKKVPTVSSSLSDGEKRASTEGTKKKYIMCAHSGGRLGNNMHQYAMLYSMTRGNSPWQACLEDDQFTFLRRVFTDSLTIPICETEVKDAHHAGLNDFKRLPKANVRIYGYFYHGHHFDGIREALRREFTPPANIQRRVLEYFSDITPPEWIGVQHTHVAIHVRRSDYLNGKFNEPGEIPSTPEYIHLAMEYFTNKYDRVQFIVASDDLKWCQENIRGSNVIFSGHNTTVDFAILTMSDHIVIGAGTFSWWAGWLCKGTTIYNGTPPPKDTLHAELLAENRAIPANDEFNHWVPITPEKQSL